jgi:hypothetical protein
MRCLVAIRSPLHGDRRGHDKQGNTTMSNGESFGDTEPARASRRSTALSDNSAFTEARSPLRRATRSPISLHPHYGENRGHLTPCGERRF